MFKTCIALAVAGIAVTAPALAEDRRTAVVEYYAYELKSDKGVERIEQQIRNAARAVCPHYPGKAPLSFKLAERKCLADAKAQAMATLEARMVDLSAEPIRVAAAR
ncbi:MAG: UrcA family protein [Maricaulaceae bacterium]